MKHTFKITLVLIGIFLISQLIGLLTVNQYYSVDEEGGIEYKPLPMNIERPEVSEEVSWLYIFGAVIIGTILFLFLIKIGSRYITKIWFFLAILIALMFAFSAYVDERIALLMAVVFAGWKVMWPNPYVHNLTEIFMYGGIAVLFHEMLTVKVVIILLVLISIYDFIAVRKLQHMIKMAQFQTTQNFFAGALVPYSTKTTSAKTKSKKAKASKKAKKTVKRVKSAILGGGDIAFPLFFSAAVMTEYSAALAIIPVITSTIALTYLLFFSEKNKFYPAMPYLTVGCLAGLVIVMLL